MKYKILIRFFLFNSATIFVLFASAQKKYPVSVQEAVNMALVNTIDLKNLRLDSAKQRAKNKEITGLALPQIILRFLLYYSPALAKRTFIMY
jgi:outer membrane protein